MQQFAKLKPFKLAVTLTFRSIYSFAKLFNAKIFIHLLSPNIIAAELCRCTVAIGIVLQPNKCAWLHTLVQPIKSGTIATSLAILAAISIIQYGAT